MRLGALWSVTHLAPEAIQGRYEKGGGGGGQDGVASPSGLSHTAAHSQHEGLYMYGPFIELKCLHCLNYSLFCPTHTNSTSNV